MSTRKVRVYSRSELFSTYIIPPGIPQNLTHFCGIENLSYDKFAELKHQLKSKGAFDNVWQFPSGWMWGFDSEPDLTYFLLTVG